MKLYNINDIFSKTENITTKIPDSMMMQHSGLFEQSANGTSVRSFVSVTNCHYGSRRIGNVIYTDIITFY